MTEQEKRPKYLTVADIADDLVVSKMTVYRLVEQGAIDAIRVGRQIRVPASAYAAYLRAEAAS